MKIAIRTTIADKQGIGHYMRMHRLATALEEQGVAPIFILDASSTLSNLPARFPVINLPQIEDDQMRDAKETLKILKDQDISAVIVDDYRLGMEWEEQFGAIPIIAVDDLLRPHCCSMLIDMKWRGEDTADSYMGLISREATALLGPSYTLLDKEFNKPIERYQKSDFRVTLSLGGGGDMRTCRAIAESLISIIEDVKISIVIGPKAINSDCVKDLAKKATNLEIVEGALSLRSIYEETDLFVGAAGGSIYELRALKIPAVTFSTASNQDTPLSQLEDIGHYLHIPNFSIDGREKLSRLIETIKANYSRVAKLSSSSAIEVDGRGAERVADAIVKLLKGERVCVEPLEPKEIELPSCEDLDGGFSIREVSDTDIGHYLRSRNLAENKQNMIQQTDISPLDHYNWWFTTKRSSFLLLKDEKPMLYIWHEKVSIRGGEYLVGGWFVCTEMCQFTEAMVALNWQLKSCDIHEAGVPWIAVISRKNRFVRALNQYMKFRDVDAISEPEVYEAIKTFFKGADEEEFFFVAR